MIHICYFNTKTITKYQRRYYFGFVPISIWEFPKRKILVNKNYSISFYIQHKLLNCGKDLIWILSLKKKKFKHYFNISMKVQKIMLYTINKCSNWCCYSVFCKSILHVWFQQVRLYLRQWQIYNVGQFKLYAVIHNQIYCLIKCKSCNFRHPYSPNV